MSPTSPTGRADLAKRGGPEAALKHCAEVDESMESEDGRLLHEAHGAQLTDRPPISHEEELSTNDTSEQEEEQLASDTDNEEARSETMQYSENPSTTQAIDECVEAVLGSMRLQHLLLHRAGHLPAEGDLKSLCTDEEFQSKGKEVTLRGFAAVPQGTFETTVSKVALAIRHWMKENQHHTVVLGIDYMKRTLFIADIDEPLPFIYTPVWIGFAKDEESGEEKFCVMDSLSNNHIDAMISYADGKMRV